MALYVGEGPRGSNGARSTLCQISITPSSTHNQIGPLWCWFVSGWACARPWPLWVSPMTSLVRLGVYLAAAPTLMGVFNQKFEALFPRAGALGCRSALLPAVHPVYLCTNVGWWGANPCSACPILHHSESGPPSLSMCKCRAAGSASGQTACPVCPTLCQSRSHHGNSSPLRPGACLRPSFQSGCMFIFYLLGVGLPCRSIFCQFWLCKEAQCVYLSRHLGSLSLGFKISFVRYK